MKKLLTLTLAFLMVLSLTACGKGGSKSTNGSGTDETKFEKPEQYDSETLVFKGGARNFGANFGEFSEDYRYVKGADGKFYKIDNPAEPLDYDESAVEHFYFGREVCRKYSDGHINYDGYSMSDIKGVPFYAGLESGFATQLLEVLSFDIKSKNVFINRSQAGGLKMTFYNNNKVTFADQTNGKVYETVDAVLHYTSDSFFGVKIDGKIHFIDYVTPQFIDGAYQVPISETINEENLLKFNGGDGYAYFNNDSDSVISINTTSKTYNINLPDGYTVLDIKDIEIASSVAIQFNDNTIYKTNENNPEKLIKVDELTKYAKAGYVLDLVIAIGDLAVLMDDNGIYTF